MPIALVALMNGSLERDYMNPDELIHGLNLGEYLALAISSSIIAFPLFLWAISRTEKSKAEKEHRERLQEELNKKFLEKLSEKENLEKSQEKLIKQLLENQSEKQDV